MQVARDSEVGLQLNDGYFHTPMQTVGHINDLDLPELRLSIEHQLDVFNQRGSGWNLMYIKKFIIHYVKFNPLVGSSYLPLPDHIKLKRACINIKNTDQKCFLWSVLAGLFPPSERYRNNRVSSYASYIDQVDTSSLKYPVSLPQIREFERLNPGFTINVYLYVDPDFIPVYLTKHTGRPKHIDLLLLKENDEHHYVLIKNMSRLISSRSAHQSRSFICAHCSQTFRTQIAFERHFPDCSKHMPKKIQFPDEEHQIVKFKDQSKQQAHPFMSYCDFEAMLIPTDDIPIPNTTYPINTHEVSGFCMHTVSVDAKFAKDPVVYSGPDAMEVFFDNLLLEQQRIAAILEQNLDVCALTRQQQAVYDACTTCKYCHKTFTKTNFKCRHHNHHLKTNNFTSPACRSCNIRLSHAHRKSANKEETHFHISIVFHNLKSYDAHFLISNFNRRVVRIGEDKFQDVHVIASSSEKFISFDINYMRFIDSVQFLSASLDTLVKNLHNAGEDNFVQTARHMTSKKYFYQKGLFPYSYFDSLKKFEEKSLPPIESFYNDLTEEQITESDYLLAQNVWKEFNCKTFEDYHNHYMKLDTLLLSDVFENFRKMCLDNYGLDPAHYITLPSFAWSAMLKFTGIELQVITDIEAELFISSNIRGGISSIMHRLADGNNPYMETYDPDLPHNYIMNFDCTNLYGFSMCEFLPYKNFNFLSDEDIATLDYLNVPIDSPTGYILEVDLDYPAHLHDLHNDYPLAAESLLITRDMLSPFCKSFNTKHVDAKKLVPNLRNKSKYVVHYRNLQLYVSLGMVVTKIYRVLSFSQKAWMKPFVDFNTQKRTHAKNDFESALFKLIVNSNFGKSMENVRLRRNFQLVCDKKKCMKLAAKTQANSFKIINEHTVLFDRLKTTIILDKPMYAGFCILELSKHLMYNFYYNVLLKRFPNKTGTLLMTDTDSLCVSLSCDDAYSQLALDAQFYDFSNYDPSHPLYSTVNKKVVGTFKDESCGVSPIQFIGLKPKMYSLLIKKDIPSKHTAKGVKRGFVEKRVRHEMYLHTLKTRVSTRANFVNFRSLLHNVQTVHFSRVCLSAYDNKRWVCNDGIKTIAFGHYKLSLADADTL